MIQVTKTGVSTSYSPREIELARSEFQDKHVIKLRKFFDQELLAIIGTRVKNANFFERTDLGIGTESCMDSVSVIGAILIVLNNSSLFDFVERLTGCAHIKSFSSRVYRFYSERGHHDSWHDDRGNPHRLVGLSVNLSDEAFEGGVFQLREKLVKKTLSVANTNAGDAILFEISESLEHRVTGVEGDNPRTVLAGWFQSAPNFHELLQSTALQQKK